MNLQRNNASEEEEIERDIQMQIDAVSRDMQHHEFKSLTDVDAKIAMDAIGITPRYQKLKQNMLKSLRDSLLMDGKLDHLADDVPNPYKPGEKIMRLFLLVGGHVTKKKVDILNKCLVNFALLQRVNSNGERVQPNTLANRLRALMSAMKDHGVNMSLTKDLKGFNGSLDAVMKEVWVKECQKRPDFGTKPNVRPISYRDDQLIRNYVKVKSVQELWNDPMGLLHIICYVLGSYFLLRGRNEHRNLSWPQVKFGVHGPNSGPLCGREYIQLCGICDKQHKITIGKFAA